MIKRKEHLRKKLVEFQRQIIILQDRLNETMRTAEQSEGKLLLEIIDIVDTIENLTKHLKERPDEDELDKQQLHRNMERLQRKLLRLLEGRGILPIVFPDGIATPGLSKIVQTEPKPEIPTGTIVATVRNGYRKGERVVRPAELITAVEG